MSNVNNLKVPICQGLTLAPSISGVSKEAFIINSMLAIGFVFVLKLYFMIFFFYISLKLLQMACKRDSRAITIYLKDYLKQKDYYDEG